MQKFWTFIVFFICCLSFSQSYKFDQYASYNCYNGYSDQHFKEICFGNSADASYVLVLIITDDVVEYAFLDKETRGQTNRYKFWLPNDFKGINSEQNRNLKLVSNIQIEQNKNLNFEYFDRNETLLADGTINKTTFTIYANKRKKKVDYTIEVETFLSEKIKNQKFSFGHSTQFISKNFNFTPKVVQSYRLLSGKNVYESAVLFEQGNVALSINVE